MLILTKHLVKKRIVCIFIAFVLYILAGVYITYPLLFHLSEYATGLGDELLIAFIQNWVIHALAVNPQILFDAPFYYPFHNALAYADVFITSSIVSYPFIKLFGEPIVGQNVILILSVIMLGFSSFLLVRYITNNYCASFLSGLLVMFSPVVLDKYVHTQVIFIFLVPLAILVFLHYLGTKRFRYYMLFLLFFYIQTLNSFLPGYFILFSVLIFVFVYILMQKNILKILLRKNILISSIITIILLLPIILPYYMVSHEFSYTRDIRDTIHFALQPEDFFYTNSFSRFEPFLTVFSRKDQYPVNASYKPGFIGMTFSVLVIVSLSFLFKHRQNRSKEVISFFLIAFLGLILSIGPFLHFNRITIHHPFPIPLPYALFYYIMPGFQGFRNSARWEMLFVIAIAVVIGIVLSQITKRSGKMAYVLYIILSICVIGEYNFPMKFQKVPQVHAFPKVYRYIRSLPENTSIVEMPIYNWNVQPYANQEFLREYYATSHFRPMMNGFSGFSPPQWQEDVTNLLKFFPSDRAIELLKKRNVDIIVVHADEFDMLAKTGFKIQNKKVLPGDTVNKILKSLNNIVLSKQIENDYIYKIK